MIPVQNFKDFIIWLSIVIALGAAAFFIYDGYKSNQREYARHIIKSYQVNHAKCMIATDNDNSKKITDSTSLSEEVRMYICEAVASDITVLKEVGF